MKNWTSFLVAARDDALYPLWRLAATTGMRRGELVGLRWVDVDLDRRIARVRQTITTIDNRPVLTTPKTKEGLRAVALDRRTTDVLRMQRESQLERHGELPEWVFTGPDGLHLNPNRVTYAFSAVLRRSGLRHIKLHGLRHTHASLLLEAGENVKTVSERLGHASVAFTLERYVHSLPTTQSKAADRFASLFEAEDLNES